MSFDIDAIRKINQVKFISSSQVKVKGLAEGEEQLITESGRFPGIDTSSNGTAVTLFKAYSPGPIVLSSSARINDPFSSQKFSALLAVVANVGFGMAPAFDIPRKFIYQGSEPLKLNIPCYLLLETDPIKDYVNPMRCLMNMYLPSRKLGKDLTETIETSEVYKTLVNGVGTIADMIFQGYDWYKKGMVKEFSLGDLLGKAYLLDIPFPYQSYKSGTNYLVLRYGRMRLAEVIITGVQLSFPVFTYDYGYPDHIAISIQVETLRPATTDMYENIFDAYANAEQLNGVELIEGR